jgi:hypothetical protein
MNDSDPTPLRDLLRAEALAGEKRAPDFEAMWSAAGARHRRERMRSLVLGAAAMIAVLGCAFGIFAMRGSRQTPGQSAAATKAELPWRSAVLLTEWQAPTDSLLPAADFLSNQN